MDEGPGIVVLVGAGPGDPGLITVAGAEALSSADVIIHDHLVDRRLLDLAPAEALRIFAGKRGGKPSMGQDTIHQILLEHARAGKRVVRLKGGDPYVFGRGAEEAEFLHAHAIAYRVVPGVTAGLGATAYAGLAVTHRDDSSAVAFVTGHDARGNGPLDWSRLAQFPGTLVVYMCLQNLKWITETLVACGKAPTTPAAVVRAGATPAQHVLEGTLANLPELVTEAALAPPAILVVGEVVRRRPALTWFTKGPLFGRTVVVTRPENEARAAARSLEVLGAEVLSAPMVRIEPVQDLGPLDDAMNRLPDFDWLVFTSANGVRAFFDRLKTQGRDLRAVGHLKLAPIGSATAQALESYHLKSDLVPDTFRSEDLAEALKAVVVGRRVLLARADRGRDLLPTELKRVAEVEQVAVYRNVDAEALPEDVARRAVEGGVDWITVTSSAIARRLHALWPEGARARLGRETRVASLSPVTSATLRELGWSVDVEATTYSWDGLVARIVGATVGEGPVKP